MATFAPGKAPGGQSAADEAGPGSAEPAGRPAPGKRAGRRLSAQERRADLLEAAVVEFAENGYHGTRTADIAARAGVSQPYVYALFPDKRALLLACHDWTTELIKETLASAGAADGTEETAEQALGRAYRTLLDARP